MMTAHGIGPSDVGRQLNLPRQTVTRWRNGEVSNMTHANLFALADLLGVSVRWLALGDPPAHPPRYVDADEIFLLDVYSRLPPASRTALIDSAVAALNMLNIRVPSRVNLAVPPAR